MTSRKTPSTIDQIQIDYDNGKITAKEARRRFVAAGGRYLHPTAPRVTPSSRRVNTSGRGRPPTC